MLCRELGSLAIRARVTRSVQLDTVPKLPWIGLIIQRTSPLIHKYIVRDTFWHKRMGFTNEQRNWSVKTPENILHQCKRMRTLRWSRRRWYQIHATKQQTCIFPFTWPAAANVWVWKHCRTKEEANHRHRKLCKEDLYQIANVKRHRKRIATGCMDVLKNIRHRRHSIMMHSKHMA